VLAIQQLLAGLLQGVDAALVGRELRLEGLVLLHLPLEVGGILGRERERLSLTLSPFQDFTFVFVLY